jgi:hypothetical protein
MLSSFHTFYGVSHRADAQNLFAFHASMFQSQSFNRLTAPNSQSQDHYEKPAIHTLLHGFGFANALADLGLRHGQLAKTIFGFNIGVEMGNWQSSPPSFRWH